MFSTKYVSCAGSSRIFSALSYGDSFNNSRPFGCQSLIVYLSSNFRFGNRLCQLSIDGKLISSRLQSGIKRLYYWQTDFVNGSNRFNSMNTTYFAQLCVILDQNSQYSSSMLKLTTCSKCFFFNWFSSETLSAGCAFTLYIVTFASRLHLFRLVSQNAGSFLLIRP